MNHRLLRCRAAQVLAAALALLATPPATAQLHTNPNAPYKRAPWDGALEIRFPKPDHCPPLSLDMPLDVMLGYIGGDSLARSYDLALRLDTLARTMPYSDTLRQAMKYLYLMDDYDPIRYFQWNGAAKPTPVRYMTTTEELRQALTYRAQVACPDTQRTAVLGAADIIAYVHVNATQTKIDTNAVFAHHATLVSCTVLDTIKGRRIPNCWVNDAGSKLKDAGTASVPVARAEGSQPSVPGACLQFEVRPEWSRVGSSNKPGWPGGVRTSINDSTVGDGFAGRPGPWVQPDVDYIVLLRLQGI
ncbi:MAG TPA: hypothetical protein VHI13_21230, partial [Candidatus Kapabacteria bacterium]|nr:hypothetical protein [Candidatus Kapabacteria bacterium]